jgi:glutamyl-tRNA synthetase
LTRLAEAAEWWQVITGPIAAPKADAETRAFLDEAAEAATDVEWDEGAWPALTAALKERTGRKGKMLFLPLRQALTGHDHGPDMATLLPLIGRAAALARLQG